MPFKSCGNGSPAQIRDVQPLAMNDARVECPHSPTRAPFIGEAVDLADTGLLVGVVVGFTFNDKEQ